MNGTFLVTLAAALLVAPMALAHYPMGTPKYYCEPVSEWDVHDYGPPATGLRLAGFVDGNVVGDCDYSGISFTPNSPCVGFEDPADPLSLYGGLCDTGYPIADYDGHSEFAFGGAVLLVESGTGVHNPAGSGSLYCYGEPGHHPSFPRVIAADHVYGTLITYTVGADYGPSGTHSGYEYEVGPRKPTAPPEAMVFDDSCGDGLVDAWHTYDFGWSACLYWGTCSPVEFPPGLDGAYYVFVERTQGHVTTM